MITMMHRFYMLPLTEKVIDIASQNTVLRWQRPQLIIWIILCNPCEDFYEYACGGWRKKNSIPDGKSFWGTFGKLNQDNQLVIKNVLEKPLSEMKSKAEKKAKYYYLSCMDANKTIETLGA